MEESNLRRRGERPRVRAIYVEATFALRNIGWIVACRADAKAAPITNSNVGEAASLVALFDSRAPSLDGKDGFRVEQ